MPAPLMWAAMLIPSAISIVGGLIGSHQSKEQQEKLQQQSQASQAQQNEMLAPYLKSSQAQLAQAQAACFGMSQATMGGGGGINPAMMMQGFQCPPGAQGQFPGFMAGYPQPGQMPFQG